MHVSTFGASFEIKKGHLDDIYFAMESEFPQNELKTYDQFLTLIEAGQYDVLLACNPEVVGYALVFRAEKSKQIWLDFIAILPEHQSKGYGSVFFEAIRRYYGPTYKGMVFEVEIPDGIQNNQERRIAYYKRLGSEILPVQYALPTESGPFPMHLMYVGEPISNIQLTVREAFDYIHREIDGKEEILNKLI